MGIVLLILFALAYVGAATPTISDFNIISGPYVRDANVDLNIIGTGDANFIADELTVLGFPTERMEINCQNPQIARKLIKVLGKGDVCLIKGSRSLRLDEVVERVVKKKGARVD